MNVTDQEIKQILDDHKTIAVVGLSPQNSRPSYRVAEYMQNHGYQICGVRPGGVQEILNSPCFESLTDVHGTYEIVDVFRASEHIPQVVDQVLAVKDKLGIKVLWLQLGIEHPEAEKKAQEAGLKVISNKCIKIEYAR